MNQDGLRVLIAASEAAPLAQTGGLAEVAGSLPLALKAQGCEVALVMPAYRQILESGRQWETAARDLPVRLGNLHLTADILTGELAPGVPVFLVRRDEFFDRSGLYGNHDGDYFDNPERFIFFSRTIPALCPGVGFVPDVVLANDWQTGLIMALLDLGAMARTAGVFTIHNQGFLGLVPPDRSSNIGLPERYYGLDGLEYFGQMSLLKSGIVFAETVVTVSPTYAREIQTPDFGHGLDGLMRAAAVRLRGILNGVDYTVWNPATDRHLAANYSPRDLSGKAMCKRDLLMKMGLTGLRDKPVLGMVTRLAAQKGCNLVLEAAEELFAQDVGLIVLGSGEERIEEEFTRLQGRFPDRVGLKIGFDPVLAHEIIAGSDMLLMPSMYEPCGLAQMFSLKYGTVPVVRATGGLNDTVREAAGENGPANGFKFGPFQSRALTLAVRRALEAFRNPDRWRAVMLAGMAEDFSWDRSALEYIEVFEKAVEARRSRKA
ncbi:MAG: glycogen synthase GlgA [Proteobacteria bacterium]|nr:glycogen synthase GlgA [Pseudomonadota bacterium]